MTIDPAFRDVAAIWGAGLSTLILLAKLLPSRPLFLLEPGQPPTADLTVRIINPSKSMRLVRERYRWKLTGQGRVIGVFTRRSRLSDAGIPGTLVLALKGESEATVLINCLGDRDQPDVGRWLICFVWRGSWMIPVGIPAFIFVSTARAKQLNAAIQADAPPSEAKRL